MKDLFHEIVELRRRPRAITATARAKQLEEELVALDRARIALDQERNMALDERDAIASALEVTRRDWRTQLIDLKTSR